MKIFKTICFLSRPPATSLSNRKYHKNYEENLMGRAKWWEDDDLLDRYKEVLNSFFLQRVSSGGSIPSVSSENVLWIVVINLWPGVFEMN